jgi:hypothetical protein
MGANAAAFCPEDTDMPVCCTDQVSSAWPACPYAGVFYVLSYSVKWNPSHKTSFLLLFGIGASGICSLIL